MYWSLAHLANAQCLWSLTCVVGNLKQWVAIASKSSNFKGETQHYVVKLPKSVGARKFCPKTLWVPGTLGTCSNSIPVVYNLHSARLQQARDLKLMIQWVLPSSWAVASLALVPSWLVASSYLQSKRIDMLLIYKTVRDFDVVPSICVCSRWRFVFVFPTGNSGISAWHIFNFLGLFWSLKAL